LTHINISILIAIYNEQENISYVVNKLRGLLELKELDSHSISIDCCFIDDGSTDDSLSELRKLKHKKISFLSSALNIGKSNALNMGINSKPNSDLFVFMDGDGQDDPSFIPTMISNLIKNNLDVISGYRASRKDSFSKNLASKLYNSFLSWIFNYQIKDINTGLKVVRKDVFKNISLYGNNHRVFVLLALLNGYTFNEIPVISHERHSGKSKYNLIRVDGIITLLTLYIIYKTKNNPSLFFTKISFYLFLFSVLLLCIFAVQQLLFIFSITNSPVLMRPMLLFSLSGITISLIIFSIGFIAEYILYISKNKN